MFVILILFLIVAVCLLIFIWILKAPIYKKLVSSFIPIMIAFAMVGIYKTNTRVSQILPVDYERLKEHLTPLALTRIDSSGVDIQYKYNEHFGFRASTERDIYLAKIHEEFLPTLIHELEMSKRFVRLPLDSTTLGKLHLTNLKHIDIRTRKNTFEQKGVEVSLLSPQDTHLPINEGYYYFYDTIAYQKHQPSLLAYKQSTLVIINLNQKKIFYEGEKIKY